jgi:hypothetical protein
METRANPRLVKNLKGEVKEVNTINMTFLS